MTGEIVYTKHLLEPSLNLEIKERNPMQYMGGKVRIAKYLVPVLQERLKDKGTFVDLFCGSCNIISAIQPQQSCGLAIKAPNRIANDLHKELIALHKAVQQGWVPPSVVTEEDYKQAKQAEDHLKAFIGFGCSFSGKYFGGYARCKRGDNYALQSANSLIKKTSEHEGCAVL